MSDFSATDAANGVYDLAVIGAGSAGFSAAITAANEGAQVALIGHGTIGGTCVNVGCIPSKAMIRMAEALYGAQHAASRFAGISGQAQVENWQQIIAAKDELVTTLRQKKYIDLLPEYNGIAYMEGKASLTPEGILVGDKLLAPKKTIIATGSHSTLPPIPGIENVAHMDSTAVLELETLPDSLMVIGGGVIGCELGQMFARAGVKVTICCRSRLLPEAEPEVSEALQTYLEDESITVCSGIGYQKIEQDGNLIRLYCENKNGAHTIEAEKLLVAAGRRANTDGLNLDGVGIELLRNGGIRVDDRLRTTRPGVYAVGDVTGRDQFVYMAAYGAKLAALNAMNGDSMVYDNSAMPWVVFTDPQVAGVGLTEVAANAAGYETKVSILPLDQLPRALAARDTRGLIKLVADDKTDILLGAQIIAPEGADSIQTAVLAIKHGMTAKDLGETIFPYLTTAEGLKLAAQSFGKDVTKLSCCAG